MEVRVEVEVNGGGGGGGWRYLGGGAGGGQGGRRVRSRGQGNGDYNSEGALLRSFSGLVSITNIRSSKVIREIRTNNIRDRSAFEMLPAW